ncbi:hypothetical protein C5167_034945 [Papaver somniferum]|uniref:Uncharacterized protein n=1 Tax=Papaver somniferum TaxID=3469 RepID=A0A4Y7KEH9_PAPSO|nr:hypothetical protein C5167_034945 [Papaver somniferum]
MLFIEEFSSGASAGLGCSCRIAFYLRILFDHIDSAGLSYCSSTSGSVWNGKNFSECNN